jgi:hypothetical protein
VKTASTTGSGVGSKGGSAGNVLVGTGSRGGSAGNVLVGTGSRGGSAGNVAVGMISSGITGVDVGTGVSLEGKVISGSRSHPEMSKDRHNKHSRSFSRIICLPLLVGLNASYIPTRLVNVQLINQTPFVNKARNRNKMK